mgnify:CR=1 FL=1
MNSGTAAGWAVTRYSRSNPTRSFGKLNVTWQASPRWTRRSLAELWGITGMGRWVKAQFNCALIYGE